jgi:hypothetical protein
LTKGERKVTKIEKSQRGERYNKRGEKSHKKKKLLRGRESIR